MAVSEVEFGRALVELRPGLVLTARRLARCGIDSAEDFVSDAVLLHSLILAIWRTEPALTSFEGGWCR